MAREYLMLLKETAFKTPDLDEGEPAAGSFAYVRLDEANAFTMRARRLVQDIPFGGGIATNALKKGDRVECKGNLRVKLCASQAALLLGWAITRINAGRTTPWTTTDSGGVMPPGDLASLSIYHAVRSHDGVTRRRRYGGCKVTSWELAGGEDAAQRIWTLNLEIEAAQPYGNTTFGGSDSDPGSTEFPAPADADFPTDFYFWSHTSLHVGGARTRFKSITLRATNMMDPHSYASKFLTTNGFYGRQATLAVSHLMLDSTADRFAFESQAQKDTAIALDNGTLTTDLDLNTNVLVSEIEDEMDLARAYHEGLTLESLYDTAVGGDQPDLSVAVGSSS